LKNVTEETAIQEDKMWDERVLEHQEEICQVNKM
jgi:hypothetical protein